MIKKKKKYQNPEIKVRQVESPKLLDATGTGTDMPWNKAKQSSSTYFEDNEYDNE